MGDFSFFLIELCTHRTILAEGYFVPFTQKHPTDRRQGLRAVLLVLHSILGATPFTWVFLDFSSGIPQMRLPKRSFYQTSWNPQTILPLLAKVHHYLNIADKLQMKYTHPQNSFSLLFSVSAHTVYDIQMDKISQHNARPAQLQVITDPDTWISMRLIQSLWTMLKRRELALRTVITKLKRCTTCQMQVTLRSAKAGHIIRVDTMVRSSCATVGNSLVSEGKNSNKNFYPSNTGQGWSCWWWWISPLFGKNSDYINDPQIIQTLSKVYLDSCLYKVNLVNIVVS